jgi:hypothetical protein
VVLRGILDLPLEIEALPDVGPDETLQTTIVEAMPVKYSSDSDEIG